MGIFDLCCQPKAKKSLDYVLKWIDSASVTLNELSASVLSLQRWQDEIDADIAAKIDDGIKQYDWSKVIPSLDNYCEKAVPALQDYIAVLNTDGSIKMGSNKISDLALANHTHSVDGFDNLDHMYYYLENNGVIFGGRRSSTLAFHLSKNSESQYIIDTSASGEIISRLGQSAVSGIFTPVRVKFDDEYHIGYYWTYQGAKSLHVAGLVFEYDNVSGEWIPARACLINDGTIPQWRKVETINLTIQHYDNTTISLNNLENYNTYYVGAIIRIVSAGGDRPGEIAGRGRVLDKSTSPYKIATSIDHSDFTSTYRTPNFDIYILDNSDTVLPYDSVPTQYSRNLISSGAVYAALNALETRVAALENA